MDVLRHSGGIAIPIPEHLGHLSGVAAAVLVPGSSVGGRGLVAIFVGVIGYGFVRNFCRVADGGGIVSFSLVIVTYSCGAAGFGGSIQGMGRPFPIHQLGIGCIHGLAVCSGIPFGYVSEGIGVGTDGSIVLAFFIIPQSFNLVPYSQITVSIISRRTIIS